MNIRTKEQYTAKQKKNGSPRPQTEFYKRLKQAYQAKTASRWGEPLHRIPLASLRQAFYLE
jgi:hypothetical protein